MSHHTFSAFITALLPLFAYTLVPYDPVVISDDGTVVPSNSPIAVCSSQNVFMAVWQVNPSNQTFNSGFSDNQGQTWVLRNGPDGYSNGQFSTAAKDSSFVVTYADAIPGEGLLGYAALTQNHGVTWTINDITPSSGSGSHLIGSPLITSFERGFNALWISDNTVWSNTSPNGSTWAGTAYPVSGTYTTDVGSIQIASNSQGLMATWVKDTDGYFSFSSDGLTWSTPTIVVSGVKTGSTLAVCGTEEGFLVAWKETGNTAKSTWTRNHGIEWTRPQIITDQISESPDFITLIASNKGIMTAWMSPTVCILGAQATPPQVLANFISTMNGTWGDPFEVTLTSYNASNAIQMAMIPSGCLFTWNNTSDSFPTARFFAFPIQTQGGNGASSFIKQVTPCKPGSPLFGN